MFLAFGRRVRELLESRDLQNTWLTTRINAELGTTYSNSAVGNWINGGREPSLDIIAAMAAVLDVEPGALAFGGVDAVVAPAATDPDARAAFEAEMEAQAQRNRAAARQSSRPRRANGGAT